MARAQLGGPGVERRRRRGGLCSSYCLEKSEGSGETAWALPLYLGAVVATFSPAEWQLVPLGCWLAEPRGRPQATGAEGVGGQQGPAVGQGPSLGPRAAPPPQQTHSGQGRGHLPGNPELLPSPCGGPALT